MDLNSIHPLKELVKEYQQEFGIDYNADSIMKLQDIINIELHYEGENINSLFYVIWSVYYGECFVTLLDSKWDKEFDKVILWNGEVIDPFQSVSSYISKKKEISLIEEFSSFAVQYTNSQEIDLSLSAEQKKEENLNLLFKSLGLKGFKPIDSFDDLLEISAAREAANMQIGILETIDRNVKEYAEYESLKELGVTSLAFKTKLNELKEKVGQNGDGDKMIETILMYMSKENLSEKEQEETDNEISFWIEKAVEQSQPEAMYLLGVSFFHGFCRPTDLHQAKYWLQKSCARGNKMACDFLKDNF